MSASSTNTCETDALLQEPSFLPTINPAVATVEEVDEWLFAQGARLLTVTELQEFLGGVRWSDVPGENPGDPDFPFSMTGQS